MHHVGETGLPASLKLETLAKWLEWEDKRPVFKFQLHLVNGDKRMSIDYSGGILAFLKDKALILASAKRDLQNPVSRALVHILQGASLKFNPADPKDDATAALRMLLNTSQASLPNVVHSLLMDASCAADTFADFCANCGYDEDSRKAFQVYEACQRNGAELRRVLGPLYKECEEALQDY